MPAAALIMTTVSTPVGPPSLLAHAGTLAAAGFTASPGELHGP